jgi:hypothetical protein
MVKVLYRSPSSTHPAAGPPPPPAVVAIPPPSSKEDSGRRAGDAVVLGGAWRRAREHMDQKQAEILSLRTRLANAEESRNCSDATVARLQEEVRLSGARGEALRQEAEVSREKMLESVALAKEVRGQLLDAMEQAQEREDELFLARQDIAKLQAQLDVEKKKVQTLRNVKDQKDKHICALVKDKSRLSDKLDVAMRKSAGLRGGSDLRREVERVGMGPSSSLPSSAPGGLVGDTSNPGPRGTAAKPPRDADAQALLMIRKLQAHLKEERQLRSEQAQELSASQQALRNAQIRLRNLTCQPLKRSSSKYNASEIAVHGRAPQA